jgi:nitrate/nitrite transporter NarK
MTDTRQVNRQLVLATVAFTVCFFAWSLLGPLGPELQDEPGLSDFETSAMVAVPVCRCCSARSCGSRSAGWPTGSAAASSSPG